MAKVIYILGLLALISIGAECVPVKETVYDVTKYGAEPDGTTDNAMAFVQAWNAACHSGGPAKLLIPKGTFSTGEVVFQGPCNATKPLVIEIQGTVLGDPDLSLYSSMAWIMIEYVDGVILNGGGTLDGQGQAVWKYKVKGSSGAGDSLPDSIVWQSVNNSAMHNINLVNSKGFHMKSHGSTNMQFYDLNITAPHNSPNTDGFHISDSVNITVTNLNIGTGDDCISIGDGNIGINISKVFCGPGHGISVGSLGKREGETDVQGIIVSNCTLTNTTNGARIKSYCGSIPLKASNIVYDDIVMNDVKNPIIIDQYYSSKTVHEPSKVKISDVHFKNIRGTTISPIAVNLNCSIAFPCEGVELFDINLTPSAGIVEPLSAAFSNAKYSITGKLNAAFVH